MILYLEVRITDIYKCSKRSSVCHEYKVNSWATKKGKCEWAHKFCSNLKNFKYTLPTSLKIDLVTKTKYEVLCNATSIWRIENIHYSNLGCQFLLLWKSISGRLVKEEKNWKVLDERQSQSSQENEFHQRTWIWNWCRICLQKKRKW